ncbi:hypothetical protein [Pollutibacter soli]|uniref:hypothetical protein n=1 Tax=Pollutibacter soli TaxID=3034157 RepID=UPI003013FDEB
MLKRYWIVVFPENRYGPKNFGVTAFSEKHARELTKQQLFKLGWPSFDTEIDKAEIIENVDTRILDQDHVIPNMGVAIWQGLWFPNCNW